MYTQPPLRATARNDPTPHTRVNPKRSLLPPPLLTRRRLLAVAVASLLGLHAAPGWTATIQVNGSTCKLQNAVRAANTDTVVGGCTAGSGEDTLILSANSTHNLEAALRPNSDSGFAVTSAITIQGNGSTIRRLATEPKFRLVEVTDGGNLTLQNSTLTGGDSLHQGGGIYVVTGGTLSLTGCTVSGNRTSINIDFPTHGGGIFNYNGTITLTNSTVSGNTSVGLTRDVRGGIHTYARGGGIGTAGIDSSATLIDSTVSGNYTAGYGGGIHNNSNRSHRLMLIRSTVSGNSAGIGGGGIAQRIGSLTLRNSTVSGNSAQIGGGIYAATASGFNIYDSTITGNTADVRGGGIHLGAGTIVMQRSLVSGNRLPPFVPSNGYNTDSRGAEIKLSGPSSTAFRNNVFGHSGETRLDALPDIGNINFTDFDATSGGAFGGGGIRVPTPLAAILDTTLRDNGGPTLTHALVPGSPAIDKPGNTVCSSTDQRGVARPQGAACDVGAVEVGPGLFQFSAPVFTTTESASTATITVTRTESLAASASVNYASRMGTARADSALGTAEIPASAGADYTPVAGTLNFAAGQASQSFTVPITNDSVAEFYENLNLTLSNPVGATLGAVSTARLVIADDDVGSVYFGSANVATTEGAPTTVLTVFRSGAATAPATVTYATANGTALAGSDYTATSGTLTFGPGVTFQSVTVPLRDDPVSELTEQFSTTLSAPSGVSLGSPATATVGILDNDPTQIHFSNANYVISEGTPTAILTLYRQGSLAGPSSVDIATQDGTAQAGSDYTARQATLSFAPGQASQTLAIAIANDDLAEFNEVLSASLSNPQGSVLVTPASASLFITDNEPSQVRFASATYTIGEASPTAILTVYRLGDLAGSSTVNVATGNGTAQAGSDYTAASGSLGFAPGQTTQTVSVPIVNDLIKEAVESLSLTLSSPAGTSLGDPAAALLYIRDDD